MERCISRCKLGLVFWEAWDEAGYGGECSSRSETMSLVSRDAHMHPTLCMPWHQWSVGAPEFSPVSSLKLCPPAECIAGERWTLICQDMSESHRKSLAPPKSTGISMEVSQEHPPAVCCPFSKQRRCFPVSGPCKW